MTEIPRAHPEHFSRTGDFSSSSRNRRKQAKPRSVKQIHLSLSSSEDEAEEVLLAKVEKKQGMTSQLLEITKGNIFPDGLNGHEEDNEEEDEDEILGGDGNEEDENESGDVDVDDDDEEDEEEEEEDLVNDEDDENEEEEEEEEDEETEKMGTPLSPSETTVSTETTSTSSSSIDEMQMSFTIGVTEGTPYPCQFCDKAFPRLSYLKRHEQIHSDQMPFRCDYCQRLFKHKRSRDRHIKLHTGDKRYKCAHCESAFSRSDHLKIHMKTHDHMKPFQCKICNRGYNTAAALTSHMQNHKRNNTSSSLATTNIKVLGEKITAVNGNGLVHSGSTHSPKEESRSSISNGRGTPNSKEANHSLSPRNRCREEHENEEMEKCIVDSDEDEEERCPSRGKRSKDDPSGIHQAQSGRGDSLTNGANLMQSPSGSNRQEQQATCGLCGNKCTHLDIHFRECHLQHLLFAGLLHNSIYHGNIPSWPSLMPPPPPLSLSHPSGVISPVQHSITNGRILSPNSPKKPKIISAYNGLSSSSATSPLHHLPLPLLCNQCSPSPSFSDFESFRVHLKSHLMASQSSLPSILPLSHHQCPYCGDVVTTDLETHIVNCHLGTVTTQYGCESCNKMFAKPEELQKHLMDIHAHHLYQCSLCRDMFDSKVSIQVHFAVKHSNECKLYKCCICGELWNNERDFKIHIKLSHLQTHLPPAPHHQHHPQTSLPPPPSSHSPSLQHPGFPTTFHLFGSKAFFKCQYCSEEFHIEFLLEKHLESQHSNQLEQQRKVNEDNGRELTLQTPTTPNKASKACSRPTGSKSSEPHQGRLSRSGSDFDLYPKSHQSTKFNGGHKSHSVSTTKSTTKCNICDEICDSLADLTDHKNKKHRIFACSTSRSTSCSLPEEDKARISSG